MSAERFTLDALTSYATENRRKRPKNNQFTYMGRDGYENTLLSPLYTGDDYISRKQVCGSANSNEHATQKSKYNVSKDTEKRTYDGIVFDSCMEMKYYRDVVLPLSRSGEITHYELQRPFELQPKFHNGKKTIQPITYVADFYIQYRDGHAEVIDTKGCADSVARIKRKMFWYLFPEMTYRWITYVKKYGGWVDYEEVNHIRRLAKRQGKTTSKMQE